MRHHYLQLVSDTLATHKIYKKQPQPTTTETPVALLQVHEGGHNGGITPATEIIPGWNTEYQRRESHLSSHFDAAIKTIPKRKKKTHRELRRGVVMDGGRGRGGGDKNTSGG